MKNRRGEYSRACGCHDREAHPHRFGPELHCEKCGESWWAHQNNGEGVPCTDAAEEEDGRGASSTGTG